MMPRIPPVSAAIVTIDVPMSDEVAAATHRATEAVAHKLARELWLERLPATWAIDASQTPCLAERIAELPGHEHALLAGHSSSTLASQLTGLRVSGHPIRTFVCSGPSAFCDPALLTRHGITAIRLAPPVLKTSRWWQRWPFARDTAERIVAPEAKALRWGLYEFAPLLTVPQVRGRAMRSALEAAAKSRIPAVLVVDAQLIATQGQAGWSAVRSLIDELAQMRGDRTLEVLTIADVVDRAEHGRAAKPTTSALRSRAA
ncbi:MAG TPA: hypothetical protein VG713_18690 [Pirellulales bacterium]|nr:hypothetical protein [Pirellulales bacterium]